MSDFILKPAERDKLRQRLNQLDERLIDLKAIGGADSYIHAYDLRRERAAIVDLMRSYD